MDDYLIKESKNALKTKSTEELLEIVRQKDSGRWSPQDVEAAQQLIVERTSGGAKKGVGGWLTFFIIIIAIILPIGAIYNFSKWADMERFFDSYSGLEALSIIDIIISIIIAAFGIYAGYQLWKVHNLKSVSVAKIFIITYAVLSLFLAIFVFSLDLPDAVNEEMIRFLIVRIAFAAIWYLYFIKSKRVRATYIG